MASCPKLECCVGQKGGSASMDACSAGGVPDSDGSCTNACPPPGWASLAFWGSNQWLSLKNIGGFGSVFFFFSFWSLLVRRFGYAVQCLLDQSRESSLLAAALRIRSAASKAPTSCVGAV